MADAPMLSRPPPLLALAVVLASPAVLADPAAVDAVVQRSTCARHHWPGRGVAPRGYMLGMGRVYAKAWCDLRRPKSVAAGLAGPDFAPGTDALALYGKARGTPPERLRALYALALGEGMRESTGNASAGINRAVRHPSAAVAEAGLFQVMPDSLHDSPWLPQLYDQYRAHPAACLRETFMLGARDRRQAVLGQGPQAEFQRFTKACPAFAVDYATVVLRTDRRKFPPVQHHRAQLLPACEDMFADIERAAADGCADGPEPGARVEGPASAPQEARGRPSSTRAR